MIDISLLPNKNEDDLPPVHLWKPDFCGDMDILIKANGDWIHQGEKLTRASMVKMFSRILWYEAEEYFLVTPVEKVRIQVEDAPFLVTQFQRLLFSDGMQYIEFLTLTGDKLILGKDDCILNMTVNNTLDKSGMKSEDDEEKPYVSVRYGMNAMIHRNVYYDLVAQGVERKIEGERHLCIQSGEHFFSLGSLETSLE